jgi:hypothetical protein
MRAVNRQTMAATSDGLTPDGRPYPPEIDAFAKQLRARGTTERGYHSEAVEDSYGEAYGSILKFSAAGGTIRKLPEGPASRPDGTMLLSAYPHKIKFAASGIERTYGRISDLFRHMARRL